MIVMRIVGQYQYRFKHSITIYYKAYNVKIDVSKNYAIEDIPKYFNITYMKLIMGEDDK